MNEDCCKFTVDQTHQCAFVPARPQTDGPRSVIYNKCVGLNSLRTGGRPINYSVENTIGITVAFEKYDRRFLVMIDHNEAM